MASRIMHYYISSEIVRRLNIKNINDFLLGGVAPDAYEEGKRIRNITHFVKGLVDGIFDDIDFDLFNQEYMNDFENGDVFLVGYLCHLVSDDLWDSEDLWHRGMYRRYSKHLFEDRKADIVKAAHRDYIYLDNKIIREYRLKYYDFKIPEEVKVKEVSKEGLERIKELFKRDFSEESMSTIDPNHELEIMVYDEVIQYIDRAIGKCEWIAKRLLTK